MRAVPKTGEPPGRTAILTAVTMVAFAANSLLCRMALEPGLIDPLSFTTVRLCSGALVLVALVRVMAALEASSATSGSGRAGREASATHSRGRAEAGSSSPGGSEASWISTLALFGYAAAFSLAYVSLETGTGALILFGAVQATMIGAGLWSGERPHPAEWLGLLLAVGGLSYLTVPGATAPDPTGVLLMLTSGVAWGVYSLRGKGARAPVLSTTASFVRASPLAVLASVVGLSWVEIEPAGLLLAVVSGTVTSGLGYVFWYRALRGLTSTRAAIVQLVVPVLAAFGGVVFLAERVSLRLVVASVLILGGVAIAVLKRRRTAPGPVGSRGPGV